MKVGIRQFVEEAASLWTWLLEEHPCISIYIFCYVKKNVEKTNQHHSATVTGCNTNSAGQDK